MTDDQSIKNLYRGTIPSVVSIYVTENNSGRRRPSGGAGSGFVFDDTGHVVTNQHVVGEAEYVELRFHDGQWRTGEVVGDDPYTDLAIVLVEDLPEAADALPVAEENPEPGERVVALGNPMGLNGTITVGYVSGTNRSSPTGTGFTIPETIQTDAAINPGNSGGPLVTLDGQVVGVNRVKGGDNIGFAISPVIVNRVVPALIEEGTFRPTYLNARTLDVSPTVAEANRLESPGGVLIVDTDGSGVKALRGSDRVLRRRGRDVPIGGDVVIGLEGQDIRSTEELTSYLLTQTEPGDTVEVTVLRDGAELTVDVTLMERPKPRSQPRRSGSRGRGRRGGRSDRHGRPSDGRNPSIGRGGRGGKRRGNSIHEHGPGCAWDRKRSSGGRRVPVR